MKPQAIVILLCLLVGVSIAIDFDNFPFTKTTEEDWENLLKVALQWKQQNQDLVLNPLILIPGLTGSNLEVKLSNARPSNILCPRNKDWSLLWIDIAGLARPDCFFYDLGQNYDTNTKSYYNNQGVEIDVVDFGGVGGVSYLGYGVLGNPVNSTDYMAPLINSLEAVGYQVGVNLAAAPYDWRQTANPGGWNSKIKSLIEGLYQNNSNLPVFVLAHSMGNLEFVSFLNTVEQSWKDQYIAGFLSAAGPWSGASLAVRALISGIKVGLIDPFRVAQEIRSFGSIIWMLPDQYLGTEPLVVVNETTSYSFYNLVQLLRDINAQVSVDIYADVVGEVANMPNPNVPTYCLYGTNKETELWYEYRNGLFAEPTTIHYESAGDGVVPLASLEKCKNFNPIATQEFNLLSHLDLIKDPIFFNYIINIINPGISGN